METYTFQAGPETERYSVETPWTPTGVRLAFEELSRDRPWLSKNIDAQLLMLVTAPFLDDAIIDPCNGQGRATGREIRAALDSWTAFDKMEQAGSPFFAH
jgi:hypothetical protein